MHFSSNTLDYMFDIWFIGQNKVFCFLSGPFLRRTRFMRVIGVGFTSKCSNAIFLGNSGSHAILKVLLAWFFPSLFVTPFDNQQLIVSFHNFALCLSKKYLNTVFFRSIWWCYSIVTKLIMVMKNKNMN